MLYRMPDDWSWSFDRDFIDTLSRSWVSPGSILENLDRICVTWDAKITHHRILREFEVHMSRKSKSNGTASNNGSNSSSRESSGAKWVWSNCRLSDEDITTLEQSDATLDYLASCLVALGDDGYGVTIKSVDSGKSRCVTIYRPDYPTPGITVGVSSFGSSVRDAILAVLFKLDNYGGGDFTGFDLESAAEGTRPRFR